MVIKEIWEIVEISHEFIVYSDEFSLSSEDEIGFNYSHHYI